MNRQIASHVAAVAILTSAAALVAVPLYRYTMHYPVLKYSAGDAVALEYLGRGKSDRATCEAKLGDVSTTLQANCPICRQIESLCLTELPDALFARLQGQPFDVPSNRYEDGSVIAYRATDPNVSLAICRAAERAAPAANKYFPCLQAGTRWNYHPGS